MSICDHCATGESCPIFPQDNDRCIEFFPKVLQIQTDEQMLLKSYKSQNARLQTQLDNKRDRMLDDLAKRAMQGFIQSGADVGDELIAKYAYDMAEAMLKEKAKRQTTTKEEN